MIGIIGTHNKVNKIENQSFTDTAILHIPQVLPYAIQPYPFSPQSVPQLFLILQPTPLL
jgi:hypothetical protein